MSKILNEVPGRKHGYRLRNKDVEVNNFTNELLKDEEIKDITKVKTYNPFSTKIKNTDSFKDVNPKLMKKKYSRKYFSPYFNSYEADLVFFRTNENLKPIIYLFIININTRYLYAIQLPSKHNDDIIRAFNTILSKIKINNLRFDGESSLNSKELIKYFKYKNIKTFSSSSNYTNHNRIIDRVIRTIRDGLFKLRINTNDINKFKKTLQELITIYNNVKHSTTGYKPCEMTNKQEFDYILDMTEYNNEVINKLREDGFYDYTPGDKVMCYLDESKTKNRFKKHRGYYIHKGIFVKYNFGNGIVEIDGKEIELPIYYILPLKN